MDVLQVMEHWIHLLRDHMSWTISISLGEQVIFWITNKTEQLEGFNRTSLGNSVKRANRTRRCHYKLLSRGSTNVKKQTQKPAINNRRWKSLLMAKKAKSLGFMKPPRKVYPPVSSGCTLCLEKKLLPSLELLVSWKGRRWSDWHPAGPFASDHNNPQQFRWFLNVFSLLGFHSLGGMCRFGMV